MGGEKFVFAAAFRGTSRRQMKVFWSNNFSKMLARCGRAAHICEANQMLQSDFPAAIAFLKTYQFAIWLFLWNKLQIRTRQRGNCSTLAGKSRGGTPFCRIRKIVFSRSDVSHETLLLGKSIANGSAESLRCLPLCCSPVLCCPNCLWMFLRLQFAWSFFVFKMANSIYRVLLDSCYCLLSTLCRGQLAPNVINLTSSQAS